MRRRTFFPALAGVAALASAPGTGFRVAKRYLLTPVSRHGKPARITLIAGDRIVRYFDISMPERPQDALYWAATDLAGFQGKSLRVVTRDPRVAQRFVSHSEAADKIRPPAGVYRERFRPQFHFSPMVGWTNDPNGLVYQQGEYHLFFQHNPYGTRWGNMTWGHAVSRDLVHWKEVGDALFPDAFGTVFSGSAVVDQRNAAGFGEGALLAFHTGAGSHAPHPMPFTQDMAFSTDRGRTFTAYAQNPVVGPVEPKNRDPKVFWHAPTRRWIMIFYVTRGRFRLMQSENLREWRLLSDVEFPGGFECPELFPLALDGDPARTRWVLWEGAGRHRIGRFDGRNFVAETCVLPSEWGANSYAGQTYNDAPGGRRILITWMRARNGFEEIYPGMPFNQQMSFPRELSLGTTTEGPRLHARPVSEIERLYKQRYSAGRLTVEKANRVLAPARGELFDLELKMDSAGSQRLTLNVRGVPLTYSQATDELSCLGKSVKLNSGGKQIDLRVLVDRTSIEIFAQRGRYVMSFCFRPEQRGGHPLALASEGGEAWIEAVKVRELRSIW